MDAKPKENSIKTNTWGKDGCSTKEKFNKKETNIWRDDITFFLYSFQCAQSIIVHLLSIYPQKILELG